MLKKITTEHLKSFEVEKIKAYKIDVENRQSELIEKKKLKKDWSNELQEELDNITVLLIDVEEILEEKMKNNIKPGTEKMVHLSLVQGRRFNPNTGKEESKPFVQMFTFSEWQLFKKNFNRLGYVIMGVIHDPYNDAAQYIVK